MRLSNQVILLHEIGHALNNVVEKLEKNSLTPFCKIKKGTYSNTRPLPDFLCQLVLLRLHRCLVLVEINQQSAAL